MPVYVVQEDYTCAFYGIHLDKEEAIKQSKEIGGMVITYIIKDGRIFKAED